MGYGTRILHAVPSDLTALKVVPDSPSSLAYLVRSGRDRLAYGSDGTNDTINRLEPGIAKHIASPRG